MAHFAQLDSENVVMNVIVVGNSILLDENGVESEELGIQFCKNLFGQDTYWKQTSYNGSFRKNYAGIGYKYDTERDAFIPIQPFSSWTLNEDTCMWDPPTPYPEEGNWKWDEDTLSWISRES